MDGMSITSAKYKQSKDIMGNVMSENNCIVAVIDKTTWYVPLDPANRHYAEIMRQVEAGELVIQDADV